MKVLKKYIKICIIILLILINVAAINRYFYYKNKIEDVDNKLIYTQQVLEESYKKLENLK